MMIFQNMDYSIFIPQKDDNYWVQEVVANQINKIRPFIYLLKLYKDKEHLNLSFKSVDEFYKFVEKIFKNEEKIRKILKTEFGMILEELENDR